MIDPVSRRSILGTGLMLWTRLRGNRDAELGDTASVAVNDHAVPTPRRSVGLMSDGFRADGETDDTAGFKRAAVSHNTVNVPGRTFRVADPLTFADPLSAMSFDRAAEIVSSAKTVAVTLDGRAKPPGSGIFGAQFGLGSPPRLYAPSAQAGVLAAQWHHGYLSFESTGAVGDALRIDFAVCSEFRPVASVNRQDGGKWRQPENGVRICSAGGFRTTACILYNPILEGLAQAGVINEGGDHILSIGGTAERNGGVGWRETEGAWRTFCFKLFCEANGECDFDLGGHMGVLLGCVATSPGGVRVRGDRYVIEKTQARTLDVHSSAVGTVLRDTSVMSPAAGGGLIDAGQETRRENLWVEHPTGSCALPDRRPRPKVKRVGPQPITGLRHDDDRVTLTVPDHGLDWGEKITVAGLGGLRAGDPGQFTAEPLTADTLRLMNPSASAYADGSALLYLPDARLTLVPFGPPWANAALPDHEVAGFLLTSEGLVLLRGVVRGGAAAPVFVLPAGHRPARRLTFPGCTVPAGRGVLISVDPAGRIWIDGAVTADDNVTLCGVMFLAEC